MEVLTAVQQTFRPAHGRPEWLHKAWKVIQAEDGRRGEEDPRRKRREELSERLVIWKMKETRNPSQFASKVLTERFCSACDGKAFHICRTPQIILLQT